MYVSFVHVIVVGRDVIDRDVIFVFLSFCSSSSFFLGFQSFLFRQNFYTKLGILFFFFPLGVSVTFVDLNQYFPLFHKIIPNHWSG